MVGRVAARRRPRGPLIVAMLALSLVAACIARPDTSPGPTPTGGATAGPPSSPDPGDGQPTPFPLDTGPDAVTLELVAEGFDDPTGVTHAGDGSGRLFVNERGGVIRILSDNGVLPEPFLDITARVWAGGERGLLGLAFHPDYEHNGRLFVNYTRAADGDTVIAEYRLAPGGSDAADRASERILLMVEQPYPNHNGGQLAFGPDGYLYIGLGDGGAGGDPHGHGQDRDTLLGSLLRIDVDRTDGELEYAIPPDNPFAEGGGAPEIWAYGLRNPWRFSFDRETGDLYIADVGESEWEEIDRQPVDSTGGENYGWAVMEGRHCFAADGCDQSPFVLPIAEYSHDFGCSVTGGYVYRGTAQPDLQGVYLLADYCSGLVWTLQVDEGTTTPKLVLESDLAISSFGEDEDGELYLVDLRGGGLYRVVAG
jgi:glucose/arabinose dehydrogenase